MNLTCKKLNIPPPGIVIHFIQQSWIIINYTVAQSNRIKNTPIQILSGARTTIKQTYNQEQQKDRNLFSTSQQLENHILYNPRAWENILNSAKILTTLRISKNLINWLAVTGSVLKIQVSRLKSIILTSNRLNGHLSVKFQNYHPLCQPSLQWLKTRKSGPSSSLAF